jgi:hypothetical protein
MLRCRHVLGDIFPGNKRLHSYSSRICSQQHDVYYDGYLYFATTLAKGNSTRGCVYFYKSLILSHETKKHMHCQPKLDALF